ARLESLGIGRRPGWLQRRAASSQSRCLPSPAPCPETTIMQRCCVPLLLSSLVLGTALAAQDVRRLSITGTGAEVSLSVTNGEEHGAVSRDGGRTWTPLGRTDLRIRWRDRAFDLAGGDPALPGLLSANRSNQLYLVQF